MHDIPLTAGDGKEAPEQMQESLAIDEAKTAFDDHSVPHGCICLICLICLICHISHICLICHVCHVCPSTALTSYYSSRFGRREDPAMANTRAQLLRRSMYLG